MMDEMQKTLARRRAKVDRSSEEPEGSVERSFGSSVESGTTEGGPRRGASQEAGQEKGVSPGQMSKGSESPRPDTASGSSDLEAVKQEILREMRKEISKAKQEIIDVIRQELSRK